MLNVKEMPRGHISLRRLQFRRNLKLMAAAAVALLICAGIVCFGTNIHTTTLKETTAVADPSLPDLQQRRMLGDGPSPPTPTPESPAQRELRLKKSSIMTNLADVDQCDYHYRWTVVQWCDENTFCCQMSEELFCAPNHQKHLCLLPTNTCFTTYRYDWKLPVISYGGSYRTTGQTKAYAAVKNLQDVLTYGLLPDTVKTNPSFCTPWFFARVSATEKNARRFVEPSGDVVEIDIKRYNDARQSDSGDEQPELALWAVVDKHNKEIGYHLAPVIEPVYRTKPTVVTSGGSNRKLRSAMKWWIPSEYIRPLHESQDPMIVPEQAIDSPLPESSE